MAFNIAILVAFLKPDAPSIEIYPYEIIHASADPNGAADIAGIALSPPVLITGLVGRKGLKCFETQIGLSVAVAIAISAPYSDYIKALYVDHGEKYNIPYDEAKIIAGREKVTELLSNR